MANTKISNLTALTAPADDDVLPIVDTSAGSTKKIELDDLFIGRSVDIGTVGAGQLYVKGSAAAIIPIVADTASSPSASAQEWKYNGTTQNAIMLNGDRAFALYAASFDNGASYGNCISLGRNNAAGSVASAFLRLTNSSNIVMRVWPDAAGLLRIQGSAEPISTLDTGGTVVGGQSSVAAAKNISGGSPGWQEAFEHVLGAAANGLRTFTYKSGAYNNEEFPNGLVTDYAPRYGMDRDATYPQGKSLNVPVALGDLFASIAILHERITAIERHLGL